MSSNWRPDDSLSERDQKGELRGARRITDALAKNKVRLGKGVITSRDAGMAAVKRDLKRTGLPRGVEHWQMPITLGHGGEFICFISRLKPGTKVPEHSHKQAVFRVVIEGELKFGRKILKKGDWMLVPQGQTYALEAGSKGCLIFYAHP